MDGFYGTYEHTVDSKGRFSIPARIRQALPREAPNQIVFVHGMETCLYGFSVPAFKRTEEKLLSLGIGSPEARAVLEMFGATATPCDLDSQGRVLVPPKMLSLVGIRENVTIVGTVLYVALWNPDNYAARFSEVKPSYQAGMQRFFSGSSVPGERD
jgi:MraZ protein